MNIESMPLYINVERVYNELRELGHREGDLIAPEDLFAFDQIHYNGTAAVETAAGLLGLGPSSRVLEIGSGVGGPARYLARRTGCQVTAVELQPHIHKIACDLTARCGMRSHVVHECGDALTHPFPNASFDAVVSWLAIHHIPERAQLLRRCARALIPRGKIYIEDLFCRAPFASHDLPDVADTIYGVSLTSLDEYMSDLRNSGFTEINATDMTDTWKAFCGLRVRDWRAARSRHIRVHGSATYERMERFFSTVYRLFESGSLGGIRFLAVRG